MNTYNTDYSNTTEHFLTCRSCRLHSSTETYNYGILQYTIVYSESRTIPNKSLGKSKFEF